ncbi:MAG TPA: GNAT family N-acetyltransferase [Pirellulales bacterium]|jgi:ribosomal protein S18 acetylase RimI-like enzyme|nr:GNAT family N-acetyltransferase [Pirellulales bacterium]
MVEADRYFARHLIEDEQGRGWLDYRLATGGAAEIVNIEVLWNHRRRGVGRRLLARLIAELPADVKAIYAFTSQVNAAAQRWYEAMGFELHPAPKLYFSMREDAYCCIKVLS